MIYWTMFEQRDRLLPMGKELTLNTKQSISPMIIYSNIRLSPEDSSILLFCDVLLTAVYKDFASSLPELPGACTSEG